MLTNSFGWTAEITESADYPGIYNWKVRDPKGEVEVAGASSKDIEEVEEDLKKYLFRKETALVTGFNSRLPDGRVVEIPSQSAIDSGYKQK